MKRKVLFLYTGNSSRSQMAEAIMNARLGDAWEAYSAGTRPVDLVHPLAVQALAEIGINHDGRSKHADEYRAVPFDLAVTVCDDAAEQCPARLPAPAGRATPGGGVARARAEAVPSRIGSGSGRSRKLEAEHRHAALSMTRNRHGPATRRST